MSDFRETVADRLERAADRMYNAGFLDEERSFRDAAAQVRAGLSVEETRAIEQRMLSGERPRLLNRLTALAAQGEYDGGGGGSDDQGSTATATGAAANEPILTEMESGASQLLSTAASTEVSNPFSTALNGWISASQPVNPFTLAPAGSGNDGSAFTIQPVDSFSGAPPDGDNPNSFTTGQNINPSTGEQNTESYAGGGGPPQSPQPTGSAWAAFGYSGPPPPILASPDLLAQLDAPANPNVASDAAGQASVGVGSLSVNGNQWAWTNFVQLGDGAYNRFDSPDGTTIALQQVGGGPVVLVSASTGTVIGGLTPSGVFVPAPPVPINGDPVDIGPAQPGTPPPATNPQSAGAPAAPPLDAPLTPAQEAQLNAAIQEAVSSAPPGPVDAGQPQNINDVLAGTDWAPSVPTQDQPSELAGSLPAESSAQPPGETAEQIQEENWSAAKAGMWDSFVDLAQGMLTMSNPLGPLSPWQPSLDWAKSGPPAPTGDPVRDAQLLDNYQSGGWVTTTVSLAAPFAAEGLLASAETAATKLPALEGMGMGGGGRFIGFTEQWLASFGETTESIAPELQNTLAPLEEEAVDEGQTVLHHIFPQEFREEFEALGIDIDKYTIPLDQQTEHIPLHVGVNTEEWAGTYNDHWAVFLEQEGITAEDAFKFATEFLNDLGLAGPEYPIVPYK
jgi:hypothetical protein